MTFAQFATYLQKLEATSSRNQMVEILADLFLQVSPKEAQEIAYLSQGRIAPLFEPLEFGMADKMVLRAMGEAFEVSSQEAEKLFKVEGDLGKAAEKLSRGAGKVKSSRQRRGSPAVPRGRPKGGKMAGR